MELEVDPNVLLFGKLVGGMLVIALFLAVAFSILGFITDTLLPKPEKPLSPQTQLQYVNWSICERKDAIQMYLQTPGSANPNVLKLKAELALYNKIANETGKASFSLDDCAK